MLAFSADTRLDIKHQSDEQTIIPNSKKAKIYENKFENYKKMYPIMKELYYNLE